MAASIQDKNRRVIPQWRTAATSTELRELDSLLPASPRVQADLTIVDERIREWESHATPAFAAEVLAAATMAGIPKRAEDAARFIVRQEERVPAPVRWLARQILDPDHAEDDRGATNRIRFLRKILNDDPRNAIRWVELAREYAAVGLLPKSISAMTVAVELAPDIRYVVRSAARLFVHAGDADRAQFTLKAGDVENDPWIMAAEIAVSSVLGKASENLRRARKLLESSRFAPRHISELASALATVEIDDGNTRHARKHLRQALIEPNSNSVGQVRWAQKLVDLEINETAFSVSRAFEARAWHNFYSASWENALRESQEWQDDEPYSSRPPALGSYVAATILQDYATAIRMTRLGLTANPSDPLLMNNLIYSLICAGELGEASQRMERFKEVELKPPESLLRTATEGLLHFRTGRPESGREHYESAIAEAHRGNHKLLLARAAVILALEEQHARSPYAESARLRALEVARQIPDADLAVILRRL